MRPCEFHRFFQFIYIYKKIFQPFSPSFLFKYIFQRPVDSRTNTLRCLLNWGKGPSLMFRNPPPRLSFLGSPRLSILGFVKLSHLLAFISFNDKGKNCVNVNSTASLKSFILILFMGSYFNLYILENIPTLHLTLLYKKIRPVLLCPFPRL